MAIRSGEAFEVYERWIRAQGGNPQEGALPTAAVVRPVPAGSDGFVAGPPGNRDRPGRASSRRGSPAGPWRSDPAAGIVCLAKQGDPIEAGQILAEVHAADDDAAAAGVAEVSDCYQIGPERHPHGPLVLEILG